MNMYSPRGKYSALSLWNLFLIFFGGTKSEKAIWDVRFLYHNQPMALPEERGYIFRICIFFYFFHLSQRLNDTHFFNFAISNWYTRTNQKESCRMVRKVGHFVRRINFPSRNFYVNLYSYFHISKTWYLIFKNFFSSAHFRARISNI